jgi:hypothetical protein
MNVTTFEEVTFIVNHSSGARNMIQIIFTEQKRCT